MTSIEDRIDHLALSKYHYWIFFICMMIVLFDGYDGSALAFTAPAMSADLKFGPGSLGMVFSAHLVGMVIGSALFGVMADKIGRRPAILISTAIFTLFTGLTAFESDLSYFLGYRFITGIGLGGAVSNAVAISAEFAPSRVRSTVVSVVYACFPLGSVVGGYVSVGLISQFGWRSVFSMGAAATVPLLILCITSFPESIRFLRERGRSSDMIERTIRRLGGNADQAELVPAADTAAYPAKSSVLELFANGMWVRTLLLWLTFFVNQLTVYFLFMWMPTIMKYWGLNVTIGIVASATQSLGGVLGAFVLARFIDRRKGPFGVLLVSYLLAFVLVSAVGSVAMSGAVAIVGVIAITGFFLNGSNVNLAAVATSFYPTSARSTGVGWAMGVGKAGGIVGSMVGGVFIQSHLSVVLLYPLAACPLLLAAAAMWYLNRHLRSTAFDEEAAIAELGLLVAA